MGHALFHYGVLDFHSRSSRFIDPSGEKKESVSNVGSRSRTMTGVGIGLILLSGILWFSLFAIPFLPLSLGTKTVVGAVVFAGVQITWWTGAAFVGPASLRKIKGFFQKET